MTERDRIVAQLTEAERQLAISQRALNTLGRCSMTLKIYRYDSAKVDRLRKELLDCAAVDLSELRST